MKKYFITSQHDIKKTIFLEDGEEDFVNYFTHCENVYAENWKEALKEYIENVLYYTPREEDSIFIDAGGGVIQFNTLVNVENSEANSNEVENWKKGFKELYEDYTTVVIEELITIELT